MSTALRLVVPTQRRRRVIGPRARCAISFRTLAGGSSCIRALLRGKGTQKTPSTVDQNDPRFTADKLASEYGVSAPTIKRDGKFANDN